MIDEQDYNIGRLLTALDDNGLSKSTVVIIFGDHGNAAASEVGDRYGGQVGNWESMIHGLK